MTGPHPRRRIALGGLFLAIAVAAAAVGVRAHADPSTSQPAAAAPDFSGSAQSVFVPYFKTPNFNNLQAMNVRISVNGGPPLSMEVDTGSDGIILGASDVPHIDPNAPPGEMVYSSSGYGLYGVWTPATIAFIDARDADGKVPVAHVPVLAARESRVVSTQAVNGKGFKGSKNPHPYMFGVGFGRGLDPHPERNPFLNLAAMRAGTMRPGYLITRRGYTLGLSGQAVGAGWAYQKLTERTVSAESARLSPGLKDWDTSRGWVTVDGQRQPQTPMLIDTGVTNFIMWTPGLSAGVELPRGTPIEVNLLGGQVHYSFRSAAAKDPRSDPVVPNRVTRTPTTSPTASVNTGLRPLAIYDYLFDADGGYLGLRPTARHP